MSWAWDFMVGCVHWMQFTAANEKASTSAEADKNGDGYMDGVGLQAQPQVGGGCQQAGNQKANEERS